MKSKKIIGIISIVISFIYIILMLVFEHALGIVNDQNRLTIFLPIAIVIYLFLSWDIIFDAIKKIGHGDIFNEDTLMVIASIGAFAILEFPEGLAVIALYKIGEMVEDYGVNKSRAEIASLVELKSYDARVKDESGEYIIKKLKDVHIDDIIYIFNGEKVPLDIELLSLNATVDQKAITGESLPIEKIKGDELFSGSINTSQLISGRVIKENKDSTINKIISLIKEATSNKSRSEKFIGKFARIYTPIVITIAFLTFIIGSSIPPFNWAYYLEIMCEILVISCPCAIVISIPMAYMFTIAKASKAGILVKGGAFFDEIGSTSTIAFDKTGTLTEGNLYVSEVSNKTISDEQLESIIYELEKNSTHPIAKALTLKYTNNPTNLELKSIKEIPGSKIEAYDIDNNYYEIGNTKLLPKDFAYHSDTTTVVVLKNGEVLAIISLEDKIKTTIKKDIQYLKDSGFKNMYILSGDSEPIVNKVASYLDIENYKANLLPEDKVNSIIELKEKHKKIAYVGDGINDAPTLANATIGISMGTVGSDVAIETSDVVITDDKINKIGYIKRLSKLNSIIVWINLIFAIGTKLTVLVLALVGIANLWIAIFADVGVMILCILHALTIRYRKVKW